VLSFPKLEIELAKFHPTFEKTLSPGKYGRFKMKKQTWKSVQGRRSSEKVKGPAKSPTPYLLTH
jgi:hypothetical protein